MLRQFFYRKVSLAKQVISVILCMTFVWTQLAAEVGITGSTLKTWYLFDKGIYKAGVNALDQTLTQSIGDLVDYTYYIGTDGRRVVLTDYEYEAYVNAEGKTRNRITKITDATTGKYIEYGEILNNDNVMVGWGALYEYAELQFDSAEYKYIYDNNLQGTMLKKNADGTVPNRYGNGRVDKAYKIIGKYNYDSKGLLDSKDIYGMDAESEAGWMAQNTTLQNEIAALQADKTALQNQISALNGDIATLQTELTSIQARITSLQTTLTSLRSIKQSYQTNLATLQAAMTALNNGDVTLTAEEQAAIDSLRAQQQSYLTLRDEFFASRQALVDQKTGLANQNATLTAEIASLDQQRATLQSQLDNLPLVERTRTYQVTTQTTVKEAYSVKIDDGCGQSHNETRYRDVQKSVTTTKTEKYYEKDAAKVADLKAKIAAVDASKSAKNTQIFNNNRTINSLASQIANFTLKKYRSADVTMCGVKVGTQQVLDKEYTLSDIEGQISSLSTQIANKIAAIIAARKSGVQSQINTVNADIASVDGQITATNNSISGDQTSAASKSASITGKRSAITSANSSITSKNSSITSKQTQKSNLAAARLNSYTNGTTDTNVATPDQRAIRSVGTRASGKKMMTSAPAASAAATTNSLNTVVQQEIDFNNDQIAVVDLEIEDIEAQLEDADNDYAATLDEIAQTEDLIDALDVQIANIDKRIARLQAEGNRVATSRIYYRSVTKDGKTERVLDRQINFFSLHKANYDDDKEKWNKEGEGGVLGKLWHYDLTSGKVTSCSEFKKEWKTYTNQARTVTIDDGCGASHTETWNDGVENKLETHESTTEYNEDEKPVTITSGGKVVGTFTYDNFGRLKQSSYEDCNGFKTTTKFDTLGRAVYSKTEGDSHYMQEMENGEYVKDKESFRLAANDTSILKEKPEAASAATQAEYESPLFTGSKVHQYLGIATVAAAAGTFLTHFHPCEGPNCGAQPPRKTSGLHANMGRATAILAVATVASGLISHWDDFHAEDGIRDPDNQHVVLGVTGAALMAYAINKSARSTVPTSHAAIAELGALTMVTAIKLTW